MLLNPLQGFLAQFVRLPQEKWNAVPAGGAESSTSEVRESRIQKQTESLERCLMGQRDVIQKLP
jgi:hypothetical protein